VTASLYMVLNVRHRVKPVRLTIKPVSRTVLSEEISIRLSNPVSTQLNEVTVFGAVTDPLN
jgi:hypothetical protein